MDKGFIRASKKIQGQGQHATGIYPVVLKKLQFVWCLKRAINMIKS